MMELKLVRCTENKGLCQLGMLLIRGQAIFLTLELPDSNNQQNISCIPAGTYTWVKKISSKTDNQPTLALLNVQGRSGILVHWGNSEEDTQGCILVGKALANFDGDICVTQSKVAWAELMKILQGIDTGTITIVNALEKTDENMDSKPI